MFEVIDDRTPKEWIVKNIKNVDNSFSMFVGYENMAYSDFYYNLINSELKETELVISCLEQQNKWYYNDEIDNFFILHKDIFSINDIDIMKAFYKSQLNRIQWDIDKELLIK